jgi:VCBS repeat-containing protein
VSPAAANNPPFINGISLGTANPTTGVVSGVVSASDPNGDTLTYTGTAAKGTVTITTAGLLTYTPTATARHAAAQIGATSSATTDLVTVTVADASGAAVSQAVTVPVTPKNSAPTATKTIGTPDLATGVVTGTITGADADKDTLTYSVPATTAKGTVAITGTGAFTYTPTAAARHAAAKVGALASDKTDTFSVTIADGYTGGTVSVPVTVAIRGLNTAPTATVSIGKPDPVTGVVRGTVTAAGIHSSQRHGGGRRRRYLHLHADCRRPDRRARLRNRGHRPLHHHRGRRLRRIETGQRHCHDRPVELRPSCRHSDGDRQSDHGCGDRRR